MIHHQHSLITLHWLDLCHMSPVHHLESCFTLCILCSLESVVNTVKLQLEATQTKMNIAKSDLIPLKTVSLYFDSGNLL